jgi:hypothetical protein
MIDNDQYRAYYERRKTGSSHNTSGKTQYKEISHITNPCAEAGYHGFFLAIPAYQKSQPLIGDEDG